MRLIGLQTENHFVEISDRRRLYICVTSLSSQKELRKGNKMSTNRALHLRVTAGATPAPASENTDPGKLGSV